MIESDVMAVGVKFYAPDLCNIYGCSIGAGSQIGAFVEIQRGAVIGQNCKIMPFAFIPEGVTLEDGVFVGPHVCFTNDRHPSAVNPDGSPQSKSDWVLERTLVKSRASIGAGAVIRCGVTIGEAAMIGCGAVVLHDVPAGATVAGNPARAVREQLRAKAGI